MMKPKVDSRSIDGFQKELYLKKERIVP